MREIKEVMKPYTPREPYELPVERVSIQVYETVRQSIEYFPPRELYELLVIRKIFSTSSNISLQIIESLEIGAGSYGEFASEYEIGVLPTSCNLSSYNNDEINLGRTGARVKE